MRIKKQRTIVAILIITLLFGIVAVTLDIYMMMKLCKLIMVNNNSTTVIVPSVPIYQVALALSLNIIPFAGLFTAFSESDDGVYNDKDHKKYMRKIHYNLIMCA